MEQAIALAVYAGVFLVASGVVHVDTASMAIGITVGWAGSRPVVKWLDL